MDDYSRQNPATRFRFLTLFLFNVFVVSLSISTALLWWLSYRSNGFHVGDTNFYVLTYSPVAVLICVVAFWRQVDHHTKIVTPWWELSNGTCRASQSLTVDYISTLQASALWTALCNRHFPVVLTTVGFVVLKIATLASTGLLLLEPASQKYSSQGSVRSSLVSKFFDVNNDTSTFDQSLLYTTYGVLAQGLTKPFGLGEGLAYQTFTPPSDSQPNSNFTTVVNAFVPSIQCLPVEVVPQLRPSNTTDPHPGITYQLLSPSCTLLSRSPEFYTLNPMNTRCPTRQLSGLGQSVNCTQSFMGASLGVYTLYLMADMRYSQELNSTQAEAAFSSEIEATTWNTQIAQMTGIICRLSYSMQNVHAHGQIQEFSIPNISQNETGNSWRLQDFGDDDLYNLFRGAISASDNILGSRSDNGYDLEYPDPMFKMMAAVAGGTYENLLNASTMSDAATLVSSQLSAQIAHQYLRQADTPETVKFEITTESLRLHVTTFSAWIIVAAFTAIFFLNTALATVSRNRPVVDCSDRLDAVIPYLRKNELLLDDLIASQACTDSQTKRLLRDTEVRFLHATEGEARLSLSPFLHTKPDENLEQPWWHPITISPGALVVTFTLSILVFSTLEILQHYSDTNTGFIRLSGSLDKDVLYLHFLPALIFLMIASLFNCIDFNVLLLSPFARMQTPTPVQIIGTKSLLSQAPPIALLRACRGNMWAAVFSSSAALVGSLMTIVVSGLYIVEVIPQMQSARFSITDTFQPVWPNSAVNDTGAALLSSLTENLNFPYPNGTFYDIVYPGLRSEGESSTLSDVQTSIQIPTWRATLDCVVLPGPNTTLKVSQSPIQNSATINATYGLPASCSFGGSNGTDSVLSFVQTFTFPSTDNNTYIGKLLDLHIGPFDPVLGSSQGELDPSAVVDNPLDCPSLAFIYGYVDVQEFAESSTTSDGFVVEVCYQKIQRAQVAFEFTGPDLTLNASVLPILDESSLEYIKSADSNSTAVSYVSNSNAATSYQFRIQEHFDKTFVVFNSTHDNPYSSIDATSRLAVDRFFQGVLFGRTPLPLNTLQVKDDQSRSQISSGILAFYRRYMAQVISLNMRVRAEDSRAALLISESQQNILGIQNPAFFTRRIVQNRNSKIVLQAMLAFMVVCGAISVTTIRMRKLLPASANPCTIWGQMSLLAGSRLCETESASTYEKSDDMKLSVMSEREVISHVQLGWWTMDDGSMRYGLEAVNL